jgi:CDP-diacylglycerol---glycerol-3-phosphate 3-phosphatidyltransferase
MATKRYGGIYAIKPWWQNRLAGIESVLVKHYVHPDVITCAGVVCAGLLGVALFASGHWSLLVVAVPPLAIGRLAANALDGLVARHTGLAHPRGEFFNECCDRISDILVFVGLAFSLHVIASLAWGVLVLALLSSYVGITAKAAGGKRQFGGLLAKADRMIFLALFSPVVIWRGPVAWNWLLLAFIPALLITLVQRYRWASIDLKQVEERSKSHEPILVN